MLKRLLIILFIAASTFGASEKSADLKVPSPDKALKTLRPGHPRIMVQPGTFDELKALVQKEELPAKMYKSIRKSADKILKKPVSEYEIPDGKRLLTTSRRVLDRVRTLALVYRLEGDPRYAKRAWQELEAAAAFKDWNPPHFLDTAEMTHAFALGYDWLYDCWTADQRRVLREAIVTLGLEPGLKVYQKKKGWHRNENNWNQVCNGGLPSLTRSRNWRGRLFIMRLKAFRWPCTTMRRTAPAARVSPTGATARATTLCCSPRWTQHWALTSASRKSMPSG